jgi:hypothetical protein
MRLPLFPILAALLPLSHALANAWEIVSSENKASLLELYTSEGCSSCPPAEQWFSQLRQSPLLWKKIVPVAFHVDYWNSLGWSDPFSSPEWSARQREYCQVWRARSIYTPEFVLNGHEWRIGEGFSSGSKTGVLKLRIGKSGEIEAKFAPISQSDRPYLLNVTPMSCGVNQAVPRGENAGRTLHHDFIALTLLHVPLVVDPKGEISARMQIPKEIAEKMDSVAAWVSTDNNQAPIQSVGGWTK